LRRGKEEQSGIISELRSYQTRCAAMADPGRKPLLEAKDVFEDEKQRV
jgi:hypothetical protein